METKKPNGYCNSCGNEITGNIKNLLRICQDCSKKPLEGKTRQTLELSGNRHKGWAKGKKN